MCLGGFQVGKETRGRSEGGNCWVYLKDSKVSVLDLDGGGRGWSRAGALTVGIFLGAWEPLMCFKPWLPRGGVSKGLESWVAVWLLGVNIHAPQLC